MQESAEALSEEARPQRRRTRFRLDAEALAVVDQQIKRMSRSGIMIRMRRHEMLSFLAERAIWCRCGAGDRELPALETPVDDPDKSYQIEGDELLATIVSLQRQKLRDAGAKVRLRLSRQRMLRAMVLKGARCSCPLPEWAVATDGPESRAAE